MKIFIYSDLHISRTSSIMPIGNDDKYTYRQKMIIETGKYLVDIIDKEQPDLIINLGDTFDQHTVTSYDIDVASEFFKCFRMLSIPHLVLVGNHEMINQEFNAIKILSNINNITVISEPCTINTNLITGIRHPDADLSNTPKDENIKLAFLPYCNHKDILEFPEGDFLFSHQDIQGSIIRGSFALPDGIDPNLLKDKYKLVFNGHIHKSSISGNVINVGSISTHSFSDDEEAAPQCYIFDTNTLDLKTFKPAICPLFRKMEIKDLSDLKSQIEHLNKSYKYILHITCPFEFKDEIKQLLEEFSDLIIANRLTVKVNKEEKLENNEESLLNLQSNIDIKQSFKDFLDITELKLPRKYYDQVLEGVIS